MTNAQPKDSEGAEALLPCPFCGGEANANGSIRYSEKHEAWWSDGSRVRDAFFVNCVTCSSGNKGLVGHQTKAHAIAAWNRRAPPATPVRGGGDQELSVSQSQPCGEASAGAEVFAGLAAEPSAPIRLNLREILAQDCAGRAMAHLAKGHALNLHQARCIAELAAKLAIERCREEMEKERDR